MKAVTFLVASVMAVAIGVATPADAAKKRAKAPENPNENGWRLVRDSMPIFIPGGGLWAAEQAKHKKPMHHHKARKRAKRS